MLSEIKGQKIKERRGNRSLKDVAEAANNVFSDVALMKWEQDKMKPKRDNLTALLKALGCTYDDISEPVELGLN